MGKGFCKPDPKDATIIALTTNSTEISDQIASMKKNTPRTTIGGSGGGTASREGIVPVTRNLPLWRIVKKAESVERDWKNWHSCLEQKKEGYYDSIYVTQKASNHGEWKKRNNERKARGKATTQHHDKNNKARSASSEGAPSKSVAAYTKKDQI